MAKYRKKPVVIDAFQYGVDRIPDWFMDAVTNSVVTMWSCKHPMDKEPDTKAYCTIRTLGCDHKARYLDWIIKGVKGELYPCKPDIFEMTYEPADGGQDA